MSLNSIEIKKMGVVGGDVIQLPNNVDMGNKNNLLFKKSIDFYLPDFILIALFEIKSHRTRSSTWYTDFNR